MKLLHVQIHGVSKWQFCPHLAVVQNFCDAAVPLDIERSIMGDTSFYLKQNINAIRYGGSKGQIVVLQRTLQYVWVIMIAYLA